MLSWSVLISCLCNEGNMSKSTTKSYFLHSNSKNQIHEREVLLFVQTTRSKQMFFISTVFKLLPQQSKDFCLWVCEVDGQACYYHQCRFPFELSFYGWRSFCKTQYNRTRVLRFVRTLSLVFLKLNIVRFLWSFDLKT